MAEGYITKFYDDRIAFSNSTGNYYDLDSINENGIFIYSNSSLNKPTNNAGIVINLSLYWDSQKAQFAHAINEAGFYYRDFTNNAWNAWKKYS